MARELIVSFFHAQIRSNAHDSTQEHGYIGTSPQGGPVELKHISTHEVTGKFILWHELAQHSQEDTPALADLVGTTESLPLIDRRNSKEDHA